MNIVIAGAGEVGTHLAKMLSHEQHDITIMDEKEKHLAFARSGLDLLPLVGNPTSPSDLEKANIRQADLFVSVTPEESKNIAACMLASNLGARKTLARINNYEYLLPKNKELFESIGVSSMIYPEMLAAKEVVAAVKRPWTRQYWELLGGELLLIGVKVRANASVIGRRLSELSPVGEEKLFHVVAIKRDMEIIIPGGTDRLQADDLAYICTTKKHVEEVRLIMGKENPEIKNLIIMGGSRIAIRASQYLPENIQIKIIEADPEKSLQLSETLPGNVMIINGDACDTNLLVQEGVGHTQAFIALTENASTNILSCLTAKRFRVYKTIAQIENLDYIPMAARLDIGSIINKKLIAASHIYRYLIGADVSNVKCLTFANANVAELVAHQDSPIIRKKIRDTNLPKDMTLGGLIRNGRPMMIDGDTQIAPDDHVMVLCLESAMHKLKKYF